MYKNKKNQPHLPDLFAGKLIPWAQDGWRRIIVARSSMNVINLPDGVFMKRCKMRGKRAITKANRRYGNTRSFKAKWPDDGLIEIESYKLICVLNGWADYQVGRYLLTCSAGNFILMPPGIPHPDGESPHLEGAHRENGFCDLLQIVPYRRGLQCWICQSHGSFHSGIPTENYLIRNEQAIAVFQLMMEEAVARHTHHKHICQNLLSTFLMMLQREIDAGHFLHPGPRVTHETREISNANFLTELDEYILGHLQRPLTLESVGRRMYLSRAQFARRIQQETGQTFIEYLTEHRLQEARVLLCDSEWTVTAISEFVGFKSSTYFHRLFREKMGMTPGEFRNKSQKSDEKSKKIRKESP